MSTEQRGQTYVAPLCCISLALLGQWVMVLSTACARKQIAHPLSNGVMQRKQAYRGLCHLQKASQCYSQLEGVPEGTDQCQGFVFCTFCFLVPFLPSLLIPFPFFFHHINTDILSVVMKCKECLLGQKELEEHPGRKFESCPLPATYKP